MTLNTVYVSGKPKVSFGDLIDFSAVLMRRISKHRLNKKAESAQTSVAWTHPTKYNDIDELSVRILISLHGGETSAKAFKYHLFHQSKRNHKFTSYELLKEMNKTLNHWWGMDDTLSVELYFIHDLNTTHEEFDEIRVYTKHKHADATKRNWEKAATLGKPSKMESKKMYNKKSSTQKSPVKRMTGNINELGKNFNKLI